MGAAGCHKPVSAGTGGYALELLQISLVEACLAESVPAEMEQLMRMYVEPLKVKIERKKRRARGDCGGDADGV